MDLPKLTVKESHDLREEIGQLLQPVRFPVTRTDDDSHWEIGGTYFIRTVTHHLTGRLTKVSEHELVIEDAAWIADDGRFAEAVKSGEFGEVEPFPDGPVIVGRGSLIDARRVTFSAPRSQR